MSNDPRDVDGKRLHRALHTLGRDPTLRRELMDWLVQAEPRFDKTIPVRDEVTGPIIDALHDDADCYEKSLADGTKFEFLYRTKIARDFLLSKPVNPNHVWEPQTTRLLGYLAAQSTGDVLIGGAYFGDHAVVLGRQLQSRGRRVHCFEPNDDQRGMLERNAALNELTTLVIHSFGLWSESSKTLRLAGFDSFANGVLAAEGESGFPTMSIDDYLISVGRQLGLLMLDIEGAEHQAMIGAQRSLRSDRPSVVFEVHRDYVDWSKGLESTPICRLLATEGYRLFAVRDFNTNQDMQGRCIELIPAATVYLDGPPHGFNMLAAPCELALEPPVFRIVDGVSPKLLSHMEPALHHPLDGMPGE
jgi:FkbM family methyltransferase